MSYQQVLKFWFETLSKEQWWQKSEPIDQSIRDTFAQVHQQARLGELSQWRSSAVGCLAEIIILDQFSRNLFRGSAQSYANDGMALALSQEAIRRKLNQQLTTEQRVFLYLPFMHSESLKIHQQAVELFSEPGLEENLKFEYLHLDIIKRFGRYPHRNKDLGRESTEEERLFLQSHPGF